MINKKTILIYSIILFLIIQIIISYTYVFYNKKHKINFSIENFSEQQEMVNNNLIAFYKSFIVNGEGNECKNIIFIHSPFESSFDSYNIFNETFNKFKNSPYNFNVFFVDLPAHGKSFKKDNFDYSFRNISSGLNSLIEKLNLTDVQLICNKFSSSIGLNMISLNDKIFSNLILIDPVFSYNKNIEIIKLKIKNNINLIKSFILLNMDQSTSNLNKYKSSYFNQKNSSNKYVINMMKYSTPISTLDIHSNISIYSLINNKNYFNSKYLKDLSSEFTSIIFSPDKNLMEEIIKNRLIN